MSYIFSGVFAPGGPGAMADLTAATGGRARAFSTPFVGFGVAFASDHDPLPTPLTPDDAELRAWSKRYPRIGLIYLTVECFGGVCEQAGFALLDGAVVARLDWRDDSAPSPLQDLFAAIGVDLTDRDFEPLTRRWFAPA